MRINRQMAAMMEQVDITGLIEADIPSPFLEVVERGWTVTPDGAVVLADLAENTVGSFSDAVQEETSVNGRGLIDYDLPATGHEREERLLRRCLAYSFACLDRAAGRFGLDIVYSYISLSMGGLDDDTLTAHVTFCSHHPELPSYVQDVESYTSEALLEIQRGDYSVSTAENGPWPVDVTAEGSA